MIYFECDYNNGMHPAILKRLSESNSDYTPGYGEDSDTRSAIEKLRLACRCPHAQIYLTVGGTQANMLVISTMLAEYEGVIAATTGHVNQHEAGAIEHSGHKVLTIPGHMGKLHADELKDCLTRFYSDESREHMVFPGMVYISQPTEYGSIYTKQELQAISEVCHTYRLPLFIDGARLGYALASEAADFDLADIASLADVFYIGGTKVGAMFGEAIVFTKNNMPCHFIARAKQRGALLAKGRMLGLQFDTLFTGDLYLDCGRHAISMKNKLVRVLKAAGFSFFYESPTNQQFVILENSFYEALKPLVSVCYWEPYDASHTVVRFATSWSTTEEDLQNLQDILRTLS